MTDRNWGEPKGLVRRIAYWVHRVKYDKAMPWAGLGILADMEAVLRLLSLEEFADWLRTQDNPELARWSEPVRNASADRQSLVGMIETNLPQAGPSYEDDVEAAGKFMTDVRGVLVECGALTADDKTTDVAGLLRVLLS